MTNINCLEGIKCPGCESEGPFEIGITGTALVSDNGIEDYVGDSYWDDDSYIICPQCGESGKVREFHLGGPQ